MKRLWAMYNARADFHSAGACNCTLGSQGGVVQARRGVLLWMKALLLFQRQPPLGYML